MSFVYVITDDGIQDPRDLSSVSVVKIGYTSDPNIYNRIRQLQTGNPRPLSIIEIHEFENQEMARQFEKLCHWRLRGHGLTGEWFEYNEKVKTFLATISLLSIHYPCEFICAFFDKHEVKNV